MSQLVSVSPQVRCLAAMFCDVEQAVMDVGTR